MLAASGNIFSIDLLRDNFRHEIAVVEFCAVGLIHMTFQEKIKNDITLALRAKDELRLSVLRMLSSAMHNRGIEKRAQGGDEALSEEEAIAVVRSETKKRRDAVREYTAYARPELAEKESQEILILEKYLPKELDDDSIEKIVGEVVGAMGDVREKDFGKVMAGVMKRIRGQASGDRVSRTVKKAIS